MFVGLVYPLRFIADGVNIMAFWELYIMPTDDLVLMTTSWLASLINEGFCKLTIVNLSEFPLLHTAHGGANLM
jgi:hypothetical protein